MLNKFKTLLFAGAALPLATGFAFAQSAPATTVPAINPPAAAAAATPTAPATGAEKVEKKTATAEKKTTHEKTDALAHAPKGGEVAKKNTQIKKQQDEQKSGAADSHAGKQVARVPADAPKPGDAVGTNGTPAKKL